LIAASACAESIDDVTPIAGVTEIRVVDNKFEPRAIEVPAGTEVTWTWAGANDHNVVGDGWNSPVQSSGTFAHRFDAPGSHDFQCTLHSGMTGRVVVTE
jgi:plastocyanin